MSDTHAVISARVSRTLEHTSHHPEYLRSADPALAAERTNSLPSRFDGL
jgi:hypothetical protein